MISLIILVTTVNLVLSSLVLLGTLLLIKRQERLRHRYFLFKKRLHLLNQFKPLYYSYEIYRADITARPETLLKEEKLVQLAKNQFFGEGPSLFESLAYWDKYLAFQEKLKELQVMSETFAVVYDKGDIQLIIDFLFWYRRLLEEVTAYKKSQLEGTSNFGAYQLSFESKLEQLEAAYTQLCEKRLLGHLEIETGLVENKIFKGRNG